MGGYDWSWFDVHMPIAADPGAVWERWATAAGMDSFFSRTFAYSRNGVALARDTHAAAGDAYELEFHHPFSLRGEVAGAEPGRELGISFGSMRVTVRCEPHEMGCLVRLVQDRIPTDEDGRWHGHVNCRLCWGFYLLNLKSVVEHGTDLRDAGLPDNPVGIDFGRRLAEAGGGPG